MADQQIIYATSITADGNYPADDGTILVTRGGFDLEIKGSFSGGVTLQSYPVADTAKTWYDFKTYAAPASETIFIEADRRVRLVVALNSGSVDVRLSATREG